MVLLFVEQKIATNYRCKGMPLSSFLLKPMQRITRYPLLIKNVCGQQSLILLDIYLLLFTTLSWLPLHDFLICVSTFP